jgi:von Willebrand factor type A domain
MLNAGFVFLTPLAGLFAVAAIVPLVAFLELLRRDRRVRSVLAMPPLPRRARTPLAAALVVVPALVALAAMQPVVELGRERAEREDAELYVVFDTSRSMLASNAPDAPTRLERAEELALQLRRRIPLVRVGIASFTDRVLPHLLPTADEQAFAATVHRSIGIEQPPPSTFYAIRATRLNALSVLGTRNFYSNDVEHRVAVVFTDGESARAGQRLGRVFERRGIRTVFVHVWNDEERIFNIGDEPEPEYRPDPESRRILRDAAVLLRGRTFGESEDDRVAETLDSLLGSEGEVRTRAKEQVALAPWVTLTAFLPLGLILRRRNL